MKKIWIPIIIVIIIIVAVVVFYKPKPKETIKIGVIVPLTGPGASIGTTLKEALEWKIEELKAQGVPIELYIEDSQSDVKQAVSAFQNLVNVKGVGLIFTITSSAGLALKPLAEENKVLVWADTTHPNQTRDSHYVLRHSNIVEKDVAVIGDFIKQKSYKRIGLIYQQDDWGVAWNQYFIDFAKNSNIEVISEAVNPKDSDFRTTITKVKAKDPDAIFLVALGPAAGLLIKQAKELEYKGDLYSSNGFILTPDAVKIAGDFAKGMYYLTYEENAQFKKDYQKKLNKEPSILGFVGYTDIELLYYAIKQTKSSDPEKIINFIKGVKEFQGKYERVEINSTGDIILSTQVKIWE